MGRELNQKPGGGRILFADLYKTAGNSRFPYHEKLLEINLPLDPTARKKCENISLKSVYKTVTFCIMPKLPFCKRLEVVFYTVDPP